MVTANFICSGRFCSKRKMCLHYKKNVDLLEIKPNKIVDKSTEFRVTRDSSGRLNFVFEHACGEETSFPYFNLITNSNKGSEAND